MKRLLLILLSLLTLISCTTDEELFLFLVLNEVTDHEVDASWRYSGNDGPVTFEIKLNDSILETGYLDTFYRITELDDGRNYTVTVTAKDESGQTFSDSFVLTTLDDTVNEGPYVLDSQEKYDEFDLTRVVGTLFIRDLDVEDLSNLQSLEALGGLYIENCQINSLNGLQNITEFINGTGAVTLISNPNLADVSAISVLAGTMGTLVMDGNNSLQDLNGLGLADDALLVLRNSPLASLDELPMGGSFRGIRMTNLPNFSDLQPFLGKSVSGFLELENIPELTSLQGLSGITSLTTRLKLINLPGLDNMLGLQNLTDVGMDESLDPAGRSLELKSLNISSLGGLNGLQNVNRLVIDECDNLSNLNGTSLSGSVPEGLRLFITRNDLLSNFCGLTTLANNSEFQTYTVTGNAYNPTIAQLRSTTDCSQ